MTRPTGAVGRADLVAAWAAGGEQALESAALQLGFRAEARTRRPDDVECAVKEDQDFFVETEAAAHPSEESQLAPIPLWRAAAAEFIDREPGEPLPPPQVAPITSAGKGVLEGPRASRRPLVSAARLEPVLRRALMTKAPSRRLDTRALAELWSRGEPIRYLPWLPRAAWPPRLAVVLDGSARLEPFWTDQEVLCRRLARQVGRSALQRIDFLEGYQRPWRASGRLHRHLPAPADASVLALSDLGFLAGEWRQRFWRAVATRHRRCGAAWIALVPCPADRWALASIGFPGQVIEWERPGRTTRGKRGLAEPDFQDRAERLLGLVAFATRVEPGLLRAVRALLPAHEADAGTEVDAWRHPELASGFSPVRGLPPTLRRRLEARFLSEPEALRRRAIATLRAGRCGSPRELWLGEVLALSAAGAAPEGSLDLEEADDARRLLFELEATLERGVPAALREGVERVARGASSERQPPALWADPQLQPVLWKLRTWTRRPSDPETLPAGVGPEVFQSKNPPRRWTLAQVGRTLRFVPAPFREEAGTPLLELEAAEPIVTLGEPNRPAEPLPLTAPLPLPPVPTLLLRTDRTAVTLRRETRESEDLRWANAGMGRDRYGLWASFRVGAVVQRMRWIPPGRIWMGSPEEEEGRWSDEGPRHLETVGTGFWLADTPCTQELWAEVMGSNPSEFKSAKRPVEQVSWDECGAFCAELAKRVSGLGPQLPFEKNWEYACRAGTDTATWLGDLKIEGENNAPLLDEIAWYGGNSGRGYELEKGYDSKSWPNKQYPHEKAGTREVATRAPNPWGLYDMLGNVHEWCEDPWRGSYDVEPDPKGSNRVFRGGSWFSPARDVRAASRGRFDPSYRGNDLGFRLARGQEAAPGEGAELQAARSASPSPGAERPSGVRAERAPGRGAPSSSSSGPSRPKGATP